MILPASSVFAFILLASSISFFAVKSFQMFTFPLEVTSFYCEKKLSLFFLHFLQLKSAGGTFIFHQTRFSFLKIIGDNKTLIVA